MDTDKTESEKILKRVASESETLGQSSLARIANQISKPSSGGVSDDDPIEVLGTKIGRAFGMVAVVVLAGYLLATYVFPG